jgi:hypothetical protein
MQLASLRARARAPTTTIGHSTLLVALVIVFPVIGLEQILHTSTFELRAQPLYEALHWLSDSLLALPLAAAAVWAGHWLASRLQIGVSTVSDVFARACMIALLLALLLVPGEALHEQADRLTHTHAALGFHSHTVASVGASSGPLAIASQSLHGLTDGLEGQAVGLPLAFVALLFLRDTRRRFSGQRVAASQMEVNS